MTYNEREAFENDSISWGYDLETDNRGHYKNKCTSARWNGWQAAKADSAPKMTEEEVKNIIENEIWGDITENGIIPSRDAIKTNIISELKAAGMEFK